MIFVYFNPIVWTNWSKNDRKIKLYKICCTSMMHIQNIII